MSKKSLEELVRGSILSSKKKYTLLGIGPMSTNLIYASLELAKEKKFPVMYIASHNILLIQQSFPKHLPSELHLHNLVFWWGQCEAN